MDSKEQRTKQRQKHTRLSAPRRPNNQIPSPLFEQRLFDLQPERSLRRLICRPREDRPVKSDFSFFRYSLGDCYGNRVRSCDFIRIFESLVSELIQELRLYIPISNTEPEVGDVLTVCRNLLTRSSETFAITSRLTLVIVVFSRILNSSNSTADE
jgi:hypothetical protein